MKKEKDIEKEKPDKNKGFSKDQLNQFQELIKSTFGNEKSEFSTDEAKELETIKIILASIMNTNYLESLSSLSDEQVDDINDAMYLYHYYKNPLILVYVGHRLKLNRSLTKDSKNLLSILSDIAGKSISSIPENFKSGILGNRFK